jgi:ubiquinone/menaquinone biosynthesis C-methylase UbiE
VQHVDWGFPLYTAYSRFPYCRDRGLRHFIRDGVDIHPADRILDVGCGIGILGKIVAPYLQEGWVEGVDLNLKLIEFGRQKIKSLKIRLYQGDARTLNYPAETFDTVMSMGLFENIDRGDTEAVLQEMLRVLKPHGKLAVIHLDIIHYINCPPEAQFAQFWTDFLAGMRRLGADLELQRLLQVCQTRDIAWRTSAYDYGTVTPITEKLISFYLEELVAITPQIEKILDEMVEFNFQFLRDTYWTKDQIRAMALQTTSPAFQGPFLTTHLGQEYRRITPIMLYLFEKPETLNL